MPDDKEMYLKLFRASEEAISVLISAPREVRYNKLRKLKKA